MSAVLQLLAAILPVSLVSAVSPVMFLNASTVHSNRGDKGSRQFIAGNALVLIVLGVAAMGLLGAAAAGEAERALASKRVDAVLALVLLAYGLSLLGKYRQGRRSTSAQPANHVPRGAALFRWGVLGMITNFTSLPLFMSAAQRIGASTLDWLAQGLVLAIVIAITLTPTWLPWALTHLTARRSELSPTTRATVTSATSMASIIACIGGSISVAVSRPRLSATSASTGRRIGGSRRAPCAVRDA